MMTIMIEDSDTSNKNIQPGYRNGIWYRKMWPDSNEKRQRRKNGTDWSTKLKKIETLLWNKKCKYLWILEPNITK